MISKVDYKSSGVDIAAGNEVVKRIEHKVSATFNRHVITGLGSFAAMYDIRMIAALYQHPVLVQSMDGVGTKMMVAKMMNKFDTIGIDLVSATTNDIVVLGAKPLTLLDYIATDKLKPEELATIVNGIADACCEEGICLVGGETAEMPDTYKPGQYSLAGLITGVVERNKAITGNRVTMGDIVLGLGSSGLHTNGYSLARKIFFDIAGYSVHTYLPELSRTVGDELLIPHRNYAKPIHTMLEKRIPIHGMAHITGGGLLENIPRALTPICCAAIRKKSIPSLPIFDVLQTLGKVKEKEMLRTFNMGIGLVVIVAPEAVAAVHEEMQAFKLPVYELGYIEHRGKHGPLRFI